MATDRKPCIATERFLQPVFDETGVVQTTRLVKPGDRADLTDVEVGALGGKARAAAMQPPEAPIAPGT